MFTVIRASYSYLESIKNTSPYYQEWGIGFMCSDKICAKNVIEDVGILR